MNYSYAFHLGDVYGVVFPVSEELAATTLVSATGYRYVVVTYLHSIVDGEAGGHGAPWRIDIESNILVWVVVGQIQELSYQHVPDLIVDLLPKKKYTIFQQA